MLNGEVTITFKGVQGSGKSILQRIAEKAIKEAGHEVTEFSQEQPHAMKVKVFPKRPKARRAK